MQWGRMERRTPLGVVARLESAAEPSVGGEGETAYIENISNHGARVITERRWQINERLLLSSLGQGFRPTPARVVYCQSLLDHRFAIGLEFDVSIFDSMLGVVLKVERP